MTNEEIQELSEYLAKVIEKRIEAGIKDKTLLAIEIKYAIQKFEGDNNAND